MSLDSVAHDGRFAVLALDHRDSLRAYLAPDDPASVDGTTLTELKRDLADGLAPLATGVMLEPEFSIPQVSRTLPPTVGFFAALESQGYLSDPGAGPTTVLDGWSVAAAQASGAAVAKLLLPYHPDHPLAPTQRTVASDLTAEAHDHGLPIVLEPLFFGLASPDERLRVVQETAEEFSAVGADLLKLPFPVDPDVVVDRRARAEACSSITDRVTMPWAILSGGGSFASFLEQVAVACEAGCSGFMVGRALWGEAARTTGGARKELITTLLRGRFASLRAAAGLEPVPW